MAGAFGFERAHYDVAMKIGERVLLPAVRAAATETLIIANGFSCREQILQATGRRALHLADVLLLALREGKESLESIPARGYQAMGEPSRGARIRRDMAAERSEPRIAGYGIEKQADLPGRRTNLRAGVSDRPDVTAVAAWRVRAPWSVSCACIGNA
jgi:hypothetical protein